MFPLPASYLAVEADRGSFDAAYTAADVIFIQRNVSGVDFCRHDYAAAFGKPTFVWPNVYFNGYNPDISYLKLPGGQLVHGPLGGYHSDFIRSGFLNDRAETEIAASLEGEAYAEAYPDSFAAALHSLRLREADCDVTISGCLEELSRSVRVAWTSDHPSNLVLARLIDGMAEAAGIDLPDCHNAGVPEMDDLVMGINPLLLAREGGAFGSDTSYKIRLPNGVTVSNSAGAVVREFYAAYRALDRVTLAQGLSC